MKKQLFWTFAGLSSFAVSLVALAPLPVVAQQLTKLNPGIEFAGVSGSLWKGQVQRLSTPQAVVNDLSWTFAPKKLLTGYLAADMEAEVKTVQLRGQCGISVTQNLHCSPLRAELDAANINQLAPAGTSIPVALEGSVIANLDDITWDRKQIPVANGRLLWDDGKITNPLQMDLGGRYQANIEGEKDGNALAVELLSQETAVVLDGYINVEPAGEYDLEVSVKASGEADPMVGAALEMVGAVQNDGSIRIIQKGKLPLPQQEAAAGE
ncbi:MAG: type II secretion system protein N [Thiolinea sp.]